MQATQGRLVFTLLVLLGINTMNFYDRQVIGAVGERVKQEWDLSDRQLSSLTIAFILLYAAVGLPLGHWADRGRRRIILVVGVLLWSVMTALAGLAWNFASLFVFRLGVGVGEASCAPAANSLLGDLFPSHRRGRAIAVFMLGLPLGLGLSYLVSGYIAHKMGWREALFVAGVPGLLLGVLAWWLPDPPRGAAETHPMAETSEGSALLAVLRIPTMWWIILSGALVNLCMYALGSFLTSLLMRYHGLNIAEANVYIGLIYGFGGGLGMLGGGWLCDRIVRHRISGRMELAAVAMAVATPCLWLAIEQPRGAVLAFAVWLLPGCLCLYFYYSAVYATIQDVIAPSRRGTAMAVYFFVFYLVAAAGLDGFGWLSDYLARQAAAGGASAVEARALGLHGAMYVVPVLTLLLVPVLFAGSRTVGRDHQRMQAGQAMAKTEAG
jgi:predicted MFS family arabinose efflux permease